MFQNQLFKTVVLTALILSCSLILFSQNEKEHQAAEKEGIVYEIITSGIYAYSFDNEEGTTGFELHFTAWLTHKWGTGLSYTAKLEEHETLHDIALLASMNPSRWLTINVGPNFGFSGEHRDFEVSMYGETELNIRPKEWFHFGPVIGFIVGKNSEVTTGIHLGFEF